MSDWGSMKMIAHGYAPTKTATEMAIEAGSDMDMNQKAIQYFRFS